MPFGSFGGSGGGTPTSPTDWFAIQLARAQKLIPGANFDTVLGDDFATIHPYNIADPVNINPGSIFDDGVRGGVLGCDFGFAGTPGTASGRLQLIESATHVQWTSPWYAATLSKVAQPTVGAQRDGCIADMIGIYNGAGSRASIGLDGDGSAGSGSFFKAHTGIGTNTTNATGPAVDANWHLFEMWSDGATFVKAAIDGTTFSTADPGAIAPAGAWFAPRGQQNFGIAQQPESLWDKWIIVTASPTPGT